MTIGEIISLLRTSIKEHSDDSDFTDQELYLYLNSAANYIKREALDKNKKLLTKQNTYDIINKLSLRQKQRTLITEQ